MEGFNAHALQGAGAAKGVGEWTSSEDIASEEEEVPASDWLWRAVQDSLSQSLLHKENSPWFLKKEHAYFILW